jgi:pimeloyl-ACP methyl ester carboxylesterase
VGASARPEGREVRMKALFDDPLWQMFAERALATMTRGGAEYGECAVTAERISAGDPGSWYDQWTETAERVESIGDASAERGHWVSAREAYLRASTYYRIAFYPLFGAPVDPRLTVAFDLEAACFDKFAALAVAPMERVEVPFEGTTLPGYLCLADGSGAAAPTLVAVNGYDSNIHEMYFSHAAPAVRRGYHCLLVDGPGQGRALIKQGLRMRPDWETVIRPVIDFAVTRAEIDPARIAVMGWSFGGFLAPRAASGDHRIAALVADPGQWEPLDAMRAVLPPDLATRLPEVDPHELEPFFVQAAASPSVRWRLFQRGLWVHGVAGPAEYIAELARYRIADVVGEITCPTLVSWSENDPIAVGAERLFDALRCEKSFVRYTAADGAGGHCEAWNRSLFDQRTFDWLDEVLRGAP